MCTPLMGTASGLYPSLYLPGCVQAGVRFTGVNSDIYYTNQYLLINVNNGLRFVTDPFSLISAGLALDWM